MRNLVIRRHDFVPNMPHTAQQKGNRQNTSSVPSSLLCIGDARINDAVLVFALTKLWSLRRKTRNKSLLFYVRSTI